MIFAAENAGFAVRAAGGKTPIDMVEIMPDSKLTLRDRRNSGLRIAEWSESPTIPTVNPQRLRLLIEFILFFAVACLW